jgi:hypothetical protein
MNLNTVVPLCVILFAILSLPAVAQDETSWTDRLSFKGDLRLRYDGIDEEGEEERHRGRYRARLGLTAQASSDVTVIAQFASGADNPVSRNVTFDGGFNGDDIGFDLFYVDWAFADGWNLYGGKMRNPLFRAGGAPLVWDGDLNPEGIAVKYAERGLFGTIAAFSVEERSSSGDSLLFAAQIGGKFELSDNFGLTAGIGYFGYSNTVGNEPFYNGSSRGNSVDIDGNYINDYKDVEVFAQLDTMVGGRPLSIYGQWVRNNEVDEEDTGYAIGADLGLGKTSLSWIYMDIEADSVIGTFNDSDFGGGGADQSGHQLKVGYKLSSAVNVVGTFYVNDIDRFQGTEHDFNRVLLDVIFSFK